MPTLTIQLPGLAPVSHLLKDETITIHMNRSEKVDKDFAGLCIWARTTTGQAIYADGVVERIYAEMMAPVEDVPDYLRGFYTSMETRFSDKIAVGAAWGYLSSLAVFRNRSG